VKPLPAAVHALLQGSAEARRRAEEALELGWALVAVAPDLRLAGRALVAAADRIEAEAALARDLLTPPQVRLLEGLPATPPATKEPQP
jgi:hypothetical protein